MTPGMQMAGATRTAAACDDGLFVLCWQQQPQQQQHGAHLPACQQPIAYAMLLRDTLTSTLQRPLDAFVMPQLVQHIWPQFERRLTVDGRCRCAPADSATNISSAPAIFSQVELFIVRCCCELLQTTFESDHRPSSHGDPRRVLQGARERPAHHRQGCQAGGRPPAPVRPRDGACCCCALELPALNLPDPAAQGAGRHRKRGWCDHTRSGGQGEGGAGQARAPTPDAGRLRPSHRAMGFGGFVLLHMHSFCRVKVAGTHPAAVWRAAPVASRLQAAASPPSQHAHAPRPSRTHRAARPSPLPSSPVTRPPPPPPRCAPRRRTRAAPA